MALSFGLYAPAGFATDPQALTRAVALLQERGSRVLVDEGALERHQRFAGTEAARLSAVARMTGADIDIAQAIRGGYGWTRLLGQLDYAALAASPVRWLGHSDFTAFQLAVLACSGLVTYTGPMAAYDFGAEEPSAFTLEHCFAVLESREHGVDCTLDGPDTAVTGMLWGGNLAMVTSLVGTSYFPNVEGGILFLEDVGEHPYRIERMLYQLQQAGVLAAQKAVLLGAFTEYHLNANDGGYDFDAMITHFRSVTSVPLYAGLPFGHVREKLTLPVGGRCALSVRSGAARLQFFDYR
jgi:muramoyltetrapeptide carboxypeptidase